jgi:hypothetical protein
VAAPLQLVEQGRVALLLRPAGLSRKELFLLAPVTEDLEVPTGDVLCTEGETGHEFFVIVEGKDPRRQQGQARRHPSKREGEQAPTTPASFRPPSRISLGRDAAPTDLTPTCSGDPGRRVAAKRQSSS